MKIFALSQRPKRLIETPDALRARQLGPSQYPKPNRYRRRAIIPRLLKKLKLL